MSELTAAPPVALPRLRERVWILGWWAGGRALVLATAAVVGALGPRGYTGNDERTHAFGLLGAWDGRWYRTVAENGYLLEPGRQSDPAFFPLFPLLLRVAHALGVGWVTAGILLANLLFLAGLVLFEAFTRDLLGAAVARRATTLLAVFPVGYSFSMAYPESAVLAAIAGAFLAARRNRWVLAAAVLALAALARPETLLVTLPLFPLVRRAGTGAAWGALLAPFAAIASFALYLWWTIDDPFAWTHAERAWGRRFTPLGVVRAVQNVPRAFDGNPWIVREIVCLVLYLVLLYAAYRFGAPRLWVLAGAAIVLLPTFSGSFDSISRFGLLAPAIFWGLATVARQRVVLALSCVLLVGAVVALPYAFP